MSEAMALHVHLQERIAELEDDYRELYETYTRQGTVAVKRKRRIAELEAENKELKKRQDIFEKELRETWDYEDSHINELLEAAQPPKGGKQ